MIKNYFLKYAVYIVPVIMLFFFARNIVMSNTSHLDAWMGGGMRMFTSVDKMLYRVSGFKAEYEGRTYFVNLRNIKSLKAQDEYLRVMPSDSRLQKTAAVINATNWCFNQQQGTIEVCDKSAGMTQIENLVVKELAVYRTSFNPTTKAVSLKLINSYNPK